MPTAVMVVSPQASFRIALEQLLSNEGLVVCSGVSNLSAFRHALNASEAHPNVILLDFWLEYAETQEFVTQLKQQGFSVVLMGTKFLGKTLAVQEGIGFLEKPFTRHDLLNAL
jgi:DNA-binding NtrC family response regulator